MSSKHNSYQHIIVTGGAGFIGSHLCNELLSMGNKVTCIDNLFSGQLENLPQESEQFTFIEYDITNTLSDMNWIYDNKLQDVKQIYHLACPASPIAYQEDQVKTVKTNCIGTTNVLELARALNAKVLLTSTSEIYGDPLEHPQVESYRGNVNTLGPRACYDEGKRIAETLTMIYHREYNLPITIVRIFNTYGPNMAMEDGRVVSNFIMQSLLQQDITIYGNGSQTRSFCYVDDTVNALILAMNYPYTGPVNIGNPGEFTIKELAEKVITLVGNENKLSYQDLPEDDPKIRRPNIDLAKQLYNWEPKIQLDEGLQKTVEYFRKKIGNIPSYTLGPVDM